MKEKTCMEIHKERLERWQKTDPLYQFRLENRVEHNDLSKKVEELQEKLDIVIEFLNNPPFWSISGQFKKRK